MSRLVRAFASDLEVATDQRTIVGLAVPFGRRTTIVDHHGLYLEEFRRGAFARTLAERGAERVRVLTMHNDRALPIGRASLLREDAGGLYAELKVSRTQTGDEVLELIRDGALDGLSICFTRVQWEDRGELVIHTEVKLHEISVVNFPAYDDARITAVRSASGLPEDPADELRLWQLRLAADYWTRS